MYIVQEEVDKAGRAEVNFKVLPQNLGSENDPLHFKYTIISQRVINEKKKKKP